jgi:hypothetical protein
VTHRGISLTESIETTPEGVILQLLGKRLTAASFFQVYRRDMAGITVLTLSGDTVQRHSVTDVATPLTRS